MVRAQLSMRQYGDTVRLVTSIGLPQLPSSSPTTAPSASTEAEQRNREIVRSSRIEDWIPGLSCDEVYHPRTWSGPETVAVCDVPTRVAPHDASQVAVTGAGSEVYSSTDRLYVTSTDWGRRPILRWGPDTTTRSDQLDRALRPHDLHPRLRPRRRQHPLRRLGGVDGPDQGPLVARRARRPPPRRRLLAVTDRASSRGTTASPCWTSTAAGWSRSAPSRGLGIGEQIQSVRWFDDLAVLVTFRQTDPLYTIDLSDPTHPRLLGALKIPGFSSYLHPIGDDRLLGLGSDATDDRPAARRPGRGLRHRRHRATPARSAR